MSELPMIRSLPGYPWLRDANARIAELEAAITEYLSEVDNQVADYNYRKVLRDRLRDLIRARPAL